MTSLILLALLCFAVALVAAVEGAERGARVGRALCVLSFAACIGFAVYIWQILDVLIIS